MSANDASWDTGIIDQVLSEFIDSQAQWLSPLGSDAGRILEHARISVAGGKRLRAAFCWWGYLAIADPIDPTSLARACSSLELLHASALVHDDYMDASDTRRGRPATHLAFAQLHRDQDWSSSPEQYGAAAAILLGDLLLSWADEMLRTCGLPSDQVLHALKYFDLTRSEVVLGQFLDISAQARGESDVDTAMKVVRYKSAKYSIERPLHIGAALAGADEQVINQLTRFGLPLGEAFQLRDDLLGVFGDPELTGKPAGDDLTEGKRTVLIALALDALDDDAARLLDQSLGSNLSDREVSNLRTLIQQSGARDQVEQVIDQLTRTALRALDEAEISEISRVALKTLADQATQRVV
ncbi:MAG TPA: polyprenyl synthetase family protein [Marmoricola sp.]|nr:polyprenyl synthetase family protein [Marmoricola sp.]HNI70218.1 polyprenyl synthetase family protein [Marmoricola sp.]HNJ78183.1 polyprenyl synthetase family protein [Marmoricola sp.]HNO38893.1 polyprenyl synthetase family protein [Marmoricola sp.]